jgi:hypothetical protein
MRWLIELQHDYFLKQEGNRDKEQYNKLYTSPRPIQTNHLHHRRRWLSTRCTFFFLTPFQLPTSLDQPRVP